MGVYSNYSFSESSNIASDNSNVLDFMIESAQNDMKMFDSVIELDFMHAYSESGLIYISEADDETATKSIGRKAKDLFNKLIKKVKEFFATFIAKIQNLMHNDINLYKDNIKDFRKASGKKIKIDGYQPVKNQTQVSDALSDEADLIESIFKNIIEEIDHARSEDEVSKVIENMTETKYLKKLKNSFDMNAVYFAEDKKKDDYEITSKDIAAIDSIMANGGKKMVDMTKMAGKDVESCINDMKKAAKMEKYMAGYEDDKDKDLAVAKANAKYKVCNKFASYVSKFTSAACNACARYVAMGRRAFIAISRKASSFKESAEIDLEANILAEASDIYTERALRMV